MRRSINHPDLYVAETDHRRLSELLKVGLTSDGKDAEHIDRLQEELNRARVVEPTAVPRGVVTMNSRVRIMDLDRGQARTFTLVFPRDADPGRGRVSVLAPIGTALLGYRVGDTIEWEMPAGTRRLRIEEIVERPETGAFNL
jgi:regulator of nucleoside diphosphate kinase